MAKLDIYSKRNKPLPDVFKYDNVPLELRRQVRNLIVEMLDAFAPQTYKILERLLCHEWGEDCYRSIGTTYSSRANVAFQDAIVRLPDVDRFLDMVEQHFIVIEALGNKNGGSTRVRTERAIAELNDRFKEHGIGYAFESGKIIRIDSQLLHAEVVKPVLGFLSDPKYAGPNQELLSAHEHYRHRRFREVLQQCGNAFESTMKAICTDKGHSIQKQLQGIWLRCAWTTVCFKNLCKLKLEAFERYSKAAYRR